jgi:hypothetical protein
MVQFSKSANSAKLLEAGSFQKPFSMSRGKILFVFIGLAKKMHLLMQKHDLSHSKNGHVSGGNFVRTSRATFKCEFGESRPVNFSSSKLAPNQFAKRPDS